MLVSSICNFQINRQRSFSKINFGNNQDKSREFIEIISSFPNVNDKNPSKQDELEYEKCYETVKDYLENNGSGNINLGDGLTNLACRGHYKIVEFLLEKYKANVNYKDVIGSTSIMYAAMNGHTKTIEILGKYGVEIDTKNKMGGYNAIMLAAMGNHTEAMDKIISINPVYINDTDNGGKTALINAVIMENNEAAEKLIDYNADLNIKSKSGKTALMYAAGNLDTELMNKLIKAGADTKITDSLGRTANEIYQFMLGMLGLKIATEGTTKIPQDLLKKYYEVIKN